MRKVPNNCYFHRTPFVFPFISVQAGAVLDHERLEQKPATQRAKNNSRSLVPVTENTWLACLSSQHLPFL